MDKVVKFFKDKTSCVLELFAKNEKVFLWIFFGLFVILTTLGILTHEPWLDEAQAWLIAQDLSLVEMFKHLKYEGHLCLWFLALMPSAKLNLPYPLPMLITNVVFIWGAVYVLLMKSPFHPVWRIMMAFSMPLIYQYGVIARPYAMGVMFLFLLAYFYKDKLKRPYLYATLIILCANTSAMALVGAIAFGLLFIYEYVKSDKDFWKKREFHILLGMALFCVAFIGMQLLGAGKQIEVYTAMYLRESNLIFLFFKILHQGLFYGTYMDFMYITPFLFLIPAWKVFRQSPKVAFFFLFNFVSLILIFMFAYNGYKWHHMFFFVYLIISFWLLHYECSDFRTGKSYKLFTLILNLALVISISQSNLYLSVDINEIVSSCKQYAQAIAQDKNLKGQNLVICSEGLSAVVPYLRMYGIEAYDCINGKKASFFDRKTGEPCTLGPERLTPEYFKRFEDKEIYLLFKYRSAERIKTDYYEILPGYCLQPARLDVAPFCVVQMKKKYKDE